VESGGLRSLRRSVQALLDCGMICEEEVAFLYAVIAEEDACRRAEILCQRSRTGSLPPLRSPEPVPAATF
jgi:hypothetical protein